MPMMVGSPDIYHPVETAIYELVVVISDIGSEIRRTALLAPNDHAVALETHLGAKEPQRAFALRYVAPLL